MSTTGNDAVRLFSQVGLVIVMLMFLIGTVKGFTSNARSDETLEAEVPNVTLATGVQSVVEESEPITESLTPRMQAVLEYVTHRYRVSPEALGPIFEAVERIGSEKRLDPLLIVAVIGIESRFNPFAESSVGAQGLMQVMPRYHLNKVPEGAGIMPLFNPVINVQVGAQVLQEAIRHQGGLIAGLQQFGGAVNDEEQAYAAKVLAEKQRLEQTTRRKD